MQSTPTTTQSEKPEITTTTTPANRLNTGLLLLLISLMIVAVALFGYEISQPTEQAKYSNAEQRQVPLVLHDVVLDRAEDFQVARSVYEYLFFGLNSSKQLINYRHSQLDPKSVPELEPTAVQLRSWIKRDDHGYLVKLILQQPDKSKPPIELTSHFSEDDFFDAIGDLILEVKTRLNVASDDYDIARHKITSINKLQDWNILARGISNFYQGKGQQALGNYAAELQGLKQQGRDYYLLDAMDSYLASMRFLDSGNPQDQQQALDQAASAFEKNPRCTIANATLGLALLLDHRSEQAYPHLFYAAESSPNPLNFYLLSVADQQSNNPRGAEYYYHRFSALKKSAGGELFNLNLRLQKPNNDHK